MKRDRIFTLCWAAILSFLLGLGSVGALTTGLDLPADFKSLIMWCCALSILTAIFSSFDWGLVPGLCLGAIAFSSPDLWTQLKTLGAAVALRLELGYGIATPGFLQGELSDSVLAALCMLSTVIMLITAYSVQKQKSCLPAALSSLIPLAGCITVIDTVPDTPWLFLWGLGLVLLLLTQGVRRRSQHQGNRLTSLLALPTVGVLVLLFSLVPRDAQWTPAIPDPFSGTASGLAAAPPKEDVDLTNLGPQRQSRTQIMEVTADFSGPLYLRCKDYDEYTGTGWSSTKHRSEVLYGFSPTWHIKKGRVEIQVFSKQDYYVIPAYTQEAQSVSSGIVENPRQETRYGFDYCTLQPDWNQVWQDTSAPIVNPRYLDLPEQTSRQAADYLSNGGWTSQNLLQRVEKIRSAVRSTAPYDLFTPNMPQDETDLAMWFLTEAPSGYCVHYATAAAVLLRASGIPARYVEGYLVQVKKGEPTTVQDLHAHAWVEYYVNGVGWVVLEATPSGGNAPEAIATTAPTVTEPSTQPTREDPTDPQNQPATAPSQPDPEEEKKPTAEPKAAPWAGKALAWIAGLCVAFALLLGQYFLRRKLLDRAVHRGNSNRCGLAAYRQLRRLYRFLKKPVPQEMTQLARKARFSSHSLSDRELKQMTRQLRLARQEAAKAPLHRRLWARWILALY